MKSTPGGGSNLQKPKRKDLLALLAETCTNHTFRILVHLHTRKKLKMAAGTFTHNFWHSHENPKITHRNVKKTLNIFKRSVHNEQGKIPQKQIFSSAYAFVSRDSSSLLAFQGNLVNVQPPLFYHGGLTMLLKFCSINSMKLIVNLSSFLTSEKGSLNTAKLEILLCSCLLIAVEFGMHKQKKDIKGIEFTTDHYRHMTPGARRSLLILAHILVQKNKLYIARNDKIVNGCPATKLGLYLENDFKKLKLSLFSFSLVLIFFTLLIHILS